MILVLPRSDRAATANSQTSPRSPALGAARLSPASLTEHRLTDAPQRAGDWAFLWRSAFGVRPLAAALIGLLGATRLAASAPAAVSLAWNGDGGNNIAGYNLYYGMARRNYSTMVPAGNTTRATVNTLTVGTTYYFAVTALDTSGLESDYSSEISYTVPSATGSPPAVIAFAATSGTLALPFTVLNGSVLQTVLTTLLGGGSATYNFSITKPGNYCVSALVNAPSHGQNTCYVNIDAQPTDPLMIWDIPVSAGFATRVASWRGNGNGNPGTDQYSPKAFNLTAGSHQLILRGQDANVALKTLYIYAAPPSLRPTRGTGSQMVLKVTGGQSSQMYDVQFSSNLSTWTAIGTVTLDAAGAAQFTDTGATTTANRFYRLSQH